LASITCTQHLLPDKFICKYSLHGRCSVKACNDAHIDDLLSPKNWQSTLKDLIFIFLRKCQPARSGTLEELREAVDAQARLTQKAIESGADVEDALCAFISSVSPLCIAFSGSHG
jgi:hypothetical protein